MKKFELTSEFITNKSDEREKTSKTGNGSSMGHSMD